MNLQPANLAYLAGLAVYVGIRQVFQRSARMQKTTIDRSSAVDLSMVGLVIVGQIVLPTQYIFLAWLDGFNYAIPLAARLLGAACFASGLWLFWRSHVDLGCNWSATLKIREAHRLVTRGVYRHVRHPMYASFFLLTAGQALLLENGVAGWSGLAAVLLLYLVRVRKEEAMMLGVFGSDYERYAARTGRIFPRGRLA